MNNLDVSAQPLSVQGNIDFMSGLVRESKVGARCPCCVGLMGPGSQALWLWGLNECFRGTLGKAQGTLPTVGLGPCGKLKSNLTPGRRLESCVFTALALMLGLCSGYLLLCDKLPPNFVV